MNLCIEDLNPNWKQDRWMKDFSPETEEPGYRCRHCQLTFTKPELHDCHWARVCPSCEGPLDGGYCVCGCTIPCIETKQQWAELLALC
jgi:hypothetical protein